VIFVFTIGLQLGPGFFASLRGTGVYLNVLAAAIVVLGALLAAALGTVLGFDPASTLGVFSGATTNTPSLGAAQHTLSGLPGFTEERAALPALAYAVTYPVAIATMIATMLLLRRVFGLEPRGDVQRLEEQRRSVEPPERRTIVVDNAGAEGVPVEALSGVAGAGVVISRVKRASEAHSRVAADGLVLRRGDLVLAVGTASDLDRWERFLGRASAEDLVRAPGPVTNRRILVTRRDVLGNTVGELGLSHLHGTVVTRITRADLEMTAVPDLRLQFGDVVHVVGEEEGIRKSAEILGNSLGAMNETHFVPVFAGIVLGIALGTLPIPIPGLPQPLRLGLAGGSLIVAILVGRLGRIGPLVLYAPRSANVAFREFGIALFFACVGLLAGPRFFQVVLSAQGLLWLAAGVCVTAVPLLAVGAVAIAVRKLDFATVSGLLAGSMTDPPALAFATSVCASDAPMTSYAAVYPLTTVLRILAAQVLAITLW
jgi:putative transport protein